MKYDDDGAEDGKKMNAVTDAPRGSGRKQDSIQYDASQGVTRSIEQMWHGFGSLLNYGVWDLYNRGRCQAERHHNSSYPK